MIDSINIHRNIFAIKSFIPSLLCKYVAVFCHYMKAYTSHPLHYFTIEISYLVLNSFYSALLQLKHHSIFPKHLACRLKCNLLITSTYYTVHSHEPSPPFCVRSTVDNIHTCTLEQIMSSPLHAYLEDNPFAAWFTYCTACRYFQGRKQNATYINATVKVVNLSSFHFLIFNRLTQFTYTAHYI